MKIGITGTAATGKSTFASLIKKHMPDFSIIELNDVAAEHDLFSGTDKFGTKIVMIEKLTTEINKMLKVKEEENIAIVGHLLPELKIRLDAVFVVRASLEELINREEKRGYQFEKIKENIISEALDYCGVNSTHISEHVYEIESDEEIERALKFIGNGIKGKSQLEMSSKPIDKMPELFSLIKGPNKYKL
jgi:broad-specificity NMP kinase